MRLRNLFLKKNFKPEFKPMNENHLENKQARGINIVLILNGSLWAKMF